MVEFKALLYGPPGVGKTTFVGSAASDPRCWPGLVLDLENGVSAIRSKTRRIKIDEIGKIEPETGKFDSVRVTEWNQLSEVFNNLMDHEGHYKLICIDTISEAAYQCLSDVIELERDNNSKRADKEVPEIQDYHVSLIRMRKLLRYFLNLDAHVILTCAATVNINPRTKMPRAEPAMQGKLILEVPHLVNTVGYFDVGPDGERQLYLNADEKFIAKDRSEEHVLGDMLENPTLPDVLNRLEGVMK